MLRNRLVRLFRSRLLPLHGRLALFRRILLARVQLLLRLLQQSSEVAFCLLQVRPGVISQLDHLRGHSLVVVHSFGAEMRFSSF